VHFTVEELMNFIAENILQRAIEEGPFDCSSKHGTPLNFERNPFQHPSNRLSFHILKNAGMKPQWLETEIKIRSMFEDAKEKLIQAVKRRDRGCLNWGAAENEFYHCMKAVNSLIRELNLQVPLMRFRRTIIRPKEELEKVLANFQYRLAQRNRK
jgi:hypothetical protein